MCRSCYRESYEMDRQRDNDSIIHSYHGYELPKARPSMLHSLHKGKPFLWMGVELEAECPRADTMEAAKSIYDTFGEGSWDSRVVLSYDSSLDSGFETITGPMSLEEHAKLWPELAPALAKAGMRSHAYHSTGMHVHVSKNFHTQLELGKMLVFLNSPKTRDNVTRIAGRTSAEYAAISPKKLTTAYRGENYSRYEALNTTNSSTNEFRIFKGTLKTGRILANIEFVHALSMYVKQCSIRVCEDWPLFWAYVLKNRSIYRNLIAHFDTDTRESEHVAAA